MIQPQDLFNIRFYAKEKFHGSYKGMHYRIEKLEEDDTKKLRVTTWPGPYNFDTTDDALKERCLFEFSNEGLKHACDHLNKTYNEKFL